MASRHGLTASSDGLTVSSDGLAASSDGLTASSDGLTASSDGTVSILPFLGRRLIHSVREKNGELTCSMKRTRARAQRKKDCHEYCSRVHVMGQCDFAPPFASTTYVAFASRW